MDLLTRPEELILLAVWQMKDDAYSITIRKRLSGITGKKWSLGSIYMPLDRLEKKGFLTSSLSESTPERGGRHKRIYALTVEGKEALFKVRDIHAMMWEMIPELSMGKE